MNSDELRYKPTGYSYRVDMNVWAGEYPIWEWEQGARMRQYSICRHTFSIPNGCVPHSVRWVADLFRVITGVLNKPETKLYIHCVGGVGRT